VSGVLATGAHAAFPGQNGQIVFAHGNAQQPGLYVVNPDGTGLHRIVASATPNIFQPLWSPDGAHILYDDSSQSFSGSFRVVDASGGAMRIVAEPPPGTIPGAAWTPDGRVSWTVRATVQQHSNAHCLLVEGEAQARFCITPPAGEARGNLRQRGRWSSTGRFAWIGSRLPVAPLELSDLVDLVSPTASTWAAGSGGGEETPVSQTRISSFDWSPDGTKLVFGTTNNTAIGVVDANGSGEHLLGHKGFHPAWSPDGTKIVFNDGEGIAVMKADGSQLVRVTSDPDDMFPDWRPATTAYVPPVSADGTKPAAPAAKPAAPAKSKKPAKPKPKKKHP
jgi:dipeptidyl aminopeptidase/acylaminoacyl peptidase